MLLLTLPHAIIVLIMPCHFSHGALLIKVKSDFSQYQNQLDHPGSTPWIIWRREIIGPCAVSLSGIHFPGPSAYWSAPGEQCTPSGQLWKITSIDWNATEPD